MDEELQKRILRIYAAIDATAEMDVSKFQPQVFSSGKGVLVYQDFRGDLSEEQTSNIAQSAIYNLAHLGVPLRHWASRTGRDPERSDQAVKKSFELQVIIDLSNLDKHVAPPRNGGLSGRESKLSEVNRLMKLSTGSQPSSSAFLTLTPRPAARLVGSGAATVVVTGTIVDKHGLHLGDLHEFLTKGTAALENLLAELGVKT